MHDRAVGTKDTTAQNLLFSQLNDFIQKGGPEENEYDCLSALFDDLYAAAALQGEREAMEIARKFDVFNTVDTNQGFVCIRPHGYPGDFEIIERIYKARTSSDPMLLRWDHYFHSSAGSRAVRARKDYCIELFDRVVRLKASPARILNVASGPCRDVFEFLSCSRDEPVLSTSIHCIDRDANAIEYSRKLLAPFSGQVSFENRNIFRCRLPDTYDLIWSAGLFDYLEDKLFVRLLEKLSRSVAPEGELVIGNFSNRNTSRSYMEFAGWHLIHRDGDDLLDLAKEAALSGFLARIDQEPNGINLFMHLARHS